MRFLVVPMNPEFLPEAALLLVGVLAGAIAIRHLFARQPGRALRIGAVSVACILLALVLQRTHGAGSRPKYVANLGRNPLALVPAAKDSTGKGPESALPMSLLLGGVLLRVATSNRYVLSVDGKQFLALDSLQSGLSVGCLVATRDTVLSLSRNSLPFRWTSAQPIRVDPHTLLTREYGKDILRVHYATPRKIEVTGNFFAGKSAEAPVVSLQNGISWRGGGIPPGTTIDLTRQGKGKIDFERSGLIRVVPY